MYYYYSSDHYNYARTKGHYNLQHIAKYSSYVKGGL